MKHIGLYYRDLYLGTLYESGHFHYTVNSNRSDEIDMEMIIHVLETIRKSGLSDTFDYDSYVDSWNNFMFKDEFEFK